MYRTVALLVLTCLVIFFSAFTLALNAAKTKHLEVMPVLAKVYTGTVLGLTPAVVYVMRKLRDVEDRRLLLASASLLPGTLVVVYGSMVSTCSNPIYLPLMIGAFVIAVVTAAIAIELKPR